MVSRVVMGDFEITLVRAGFYWWDGGAMFGVVPKTLWSRHFAADESNRVRLGFNCYVVRTGDHSILIETGAGDKLDHKARERMKLLDACLCYPRFSRVKNVGQSFTAVLDDGHAETPVLL
jgi:hypothetical protein